MFTTVPPLTWKPVGAFIQALAVTTNQAEAVPPRTMGSEQSQWARGERRSQPYRYRPRKMPSVKKAKPSSANGRPITPLAYPMKRGHNRPNSKESEIGRAHV